VVCAKGPVARLFVVGLEKKEVARVLVSSGLRKSHHSLHLCDRGGDAKLLKR